MITNNKGLLLMAILHEILIPLQSAFSNTPLGKNRAELFIYTLMGIIIPFTSSITSNLLRSLETLFGFNLNQALYYWFMATSTIPWDKLWLMVWSLTPSPTTGGYILLALDDCINTTNSRLLKRSRKKNICLWNGLWSCCYQQ